MPTFAERLRELRAEAGQTQTQLAESSGLPLGSLRNYEQGNREPYWDVVFKLARALGVPVEVFAACVDAGDVPARAKGRPSAKKAEEPATTPKSKATPTAKGKKK